MSEKNKFMCSVLCRYRQLLTNIARAYIQYTRQGWMTRVRSGLRRWSCVLSNTVLPILSTMRRQNRNTWSSNKHADLKICQGRLLISGEQEVCVPLNKALTILARQKLEVCTFLLSKLESC